MKNSFYSMLPFVKKGEKSESLTAFALKGYERKQPNYM